MENKSKSPDSGGIKATPAAGAAAPETARAGRLTTLLEAAGARRLVRCHDGSGEPFDAYDKDIADGVVARLLAKMHAMETAADQFCDDHCTWRDHIPGCVRAATAPVSEAPTADEWEPNNGNGVWHRPREHSTLSRKLDPARATHPELADDIDARFAPVSEAGQAQGDAERIKELARKHAAWKSADLKFGVHFYEESLLRFVAALAALAQPAAMDEAAERAKIVRGLEVAMTLADAIPTKAHEADDNDLRYLGAIVNVRGGYAAIRDGLEAAHAALAAPQGNSEQAGAGQPWRLTLADAEKMSKSALYVRYCHLSEELKAAQGCIERYAAELQAAIAPQAAELPAATSQNLELVIARLEQIAAGAVDDNREAAAQALPCARAVLESLALRQPQGGGYEALKAELDLAVDDFAAKQAGKEGA